MRNLKLLGLLLIAPWIATAQSWKAVSSEKIILPTHTPEAVILTKNESEGKFAYTISYQIGDRVLITRAIPTETYTEMKKTLSHEVLSLTKVDTRGTCIRYFDFEERTAGSKTSIRHCLSATKQRRAAEDAFARWYKSAREKLGI